MGSSTDGLIVSEHAENAYQGVFEQKNPMGKTLVSYLTSDTMPTEYIPQVQGELWVTDLDWCDFMVYHPLIGHKIWRVGRDEKFITHMSGAVNRFIERMLKKREQLKQYKR